MKKAGSRRIGLLDELRGACVLLMVVYHALYTLGYYAEWAFAMRAFVFFMPAEPFFAGVFVALCGFCCTLSRNNWRRGAQLLVIAAVISFVMAVGFSENAIWFGILHLLAVCILLYAVVEKGLKRVPWWVGVPVCVLLAVFLWHLPVQESAGYVGFPGHPLWTVPDKVTAQVWLYPLGLGRLEGPQGDYFPLIPWAFVFFAGAFAGRLVPYLSAWCRRIHCRPLAFLGRHALVIYVAHQPIIYGVWFLCHRVIG